MLYLATLAEGKTHLGIKDAEDDSSMTLAIQGLQGRFDGHCSRKFLYSAAEVEFMDGNRFSLALRRFPIESVSTVHVDTDQLWETDTLLDSDGYRVNKAQGLVFYGTSEGKRWPAGLQNIRVVYSGGFVKADGTASANVDAQDLEALKAAFLMQLAFEWRNKAHLGQQSMSAQGVSVNLAPAKLLPEVSEILEPFRRL